MNWIVTRLMLVAAFVERRGYRCRLWSSGYLESRKPPICPRCKGTGNERPPAWLLCAMCDGKGRVQ